MSSPEESPDNIECQEKEQIPELLTRVAIELGFKPTDELEQVKIEALRVLQEEGTKENFYELITKLTDLGESVVQEVSEDKSSLPKVGFLAYRAALLSMISQEEGPNEDLNDELYDISTIIDNELRTNPTTELQNIFSELAQLLNDLGIVKFHQ